ncbi:hypothetical protein AAY85_25510 [Pseudomonas amygdali pv. lachrymans]|nr:hypothetical protein AAY85_25510 [Pseudomonas amygdali pv. lachrymans]RMV54919.1 hypothetical protein ALP09_200059 [Pseudomonas amygdali pv. lachrymans]
MGARKKARRFGLVRGFRLTTGSEEVERLFSSKRNAKVGIAVYGIHPMKSQFEPMTPRAVTVGQKTIDAEVDLNLIWLQMQLAIGFEYDFTKTSADLRNV